MAEHKHYSEYIEFMDGRVVLYKRRDHKNPKFTARIKIPNRVIYIVKSTKTADETKARNFAKQLYYDLEGKFLRGETVTKLYFSKVFDDWVSLRKIEGKDKVYTKSDIRSTEKNILPFFKHYDIREITSSLIVKFFSERQNEIPQPSTGTLKQDIRRLKSILNFAKGKGIISDIPTFPSFTGKPNTRPDFTQKEYNTLVKSMRKFVDDAKDNKFHYRNRFYLHHYVLILKNSGIRVGEARKLRWVDIGTTKTVNGGTRLVFSVSGKTGDRDVVCMERVNTYTKRLYDFRTNELGESPSPDEFVFCHKNGKAIETFKKSFRSLMEFSGLLLDNKGNRRVIYSLRHTYATMRLQDGVNVYQLAINMGTSVEMIEKFYGKKRTTAKGATELTKYFKGKSKKGETHTLPWE